jgi:hypothetical protein
MGCSTCDYAERNGWYGNGVSHCAVCHTTWHGEMPCHCGTCHKQLATNLAYDGHKCLKGVVISERPPKRKSESCIVCGLGSLRSKSNEIRQGGVTFYAHPACRVLWRRMPRFTGKGNPALLPGAPYDVPKKLTRKELARIVTLPITNCATLPTGRICAADDLQRSPCPGHSSESVRLNTKRASARIPTLPELDDVFERDGWRSDTYQAALRLWVKGSALLKRGTLTDPSEPEQEMPSEAPKHPYKTYRRDVSSSEAA